MVQTNFYEALSFRLSSEALNPHIQICNKWRLNADGSERIERSGEEWDGRGWFQKGGETLVNGNKVHCAKIRTSGSLERKCFLVDAYFYVGEHSRFL